MPPTYLIDTQEKPAPCQTRGGSNNNTEYSTQAGGNKSPVEKDSTRGLPRQGDRAYFKNPVNFRQWFQVIMRTWSRELPPKELALVLFLFDRTFGWGKEWEHMTMDVIINGNTDNKGRVTTGAVAVSPRVLARMLDALVARGMVRRKRTRCGQWLALNYEWQQNPLQHVAAKPKDDMKKNQAPQETTLEEAIASAIHRNRDRREAKLARRKGAAPSLTALQTAWSTACAEAGNRQAIGGKDAAALRSMAVRMCKDGMGAEDFLAMLRWTLTQWKTLLDVEFHWMEDPPALPPPLLVVRFGAKLRSAWEDRDRIAAMAQVQGKARTLLRLEAAGVEESTARRIVSRRLLVNRNTLPEIPRENRTEGEWRWTLI